MGVNGLIGRWELSASPAGPGRHQAWLAASLTAIERLPGHMAFLHSWETEICRGTARRILKRI